MYSIKQLLEGYENKTFSPVEITKDYIERAKRNEDLNAYISLTEDVALQQAKIAEMKWQLGDAGTLEGIPLSYKDNYHSKGIRSTSGSKIDQDFIPDKDADIIHKMNQEGAVMIGKNNLHEFAFGITNNNPFYGPAKNPWNKELTPGGSSGGSAVAVATDLSVASLGTDTGGSIRIPAASCGLVGLKPTEGLLSRGGITPISDSLDHVGPITRDINDLTTMMEALTGNDYTMQERQDLRGVKIGVPKAFFNEKIEADVLASYEATIEQLEQLGAHLVEVDVPFAEESVPHIFTLAIAEGGFTHRYRLVDHLEDYGPDVKHVMEASQSILSADYLVALERKREIANACDALLEQVDFIITPTTPAQPKPIGQESVNWDGEEEPIFDCMIRYASYFNLTGHPAISLPVGLQNGVPVGVQLVAAKGEERDLLAVSKVYEDHYLREFYADRNKELSEGTKV